jgi:hypothetical protein
MVSRGAIEGLNCVPARHAPLQAEAAGAMLVSARATICAADAMGFPREKPNSARFNGHRQTC